jgi:hypothetical protein
MSTPNPITRSLKVAAQPETRRYKSTMRQLLLYLAAVFPLASTYAQTNTGTSPMLQLRPSGPQFELNVPAETNAGVLLLFQAQDLNALAFAPTLSLVTNAPVGIDLRLPLAPAQRAFFYAIRKADVSLADFFPPQIPDEPASPYALWVLGLPTNLVSGDLYLADFLLVGDSNQLATVNGPGTLSVVRQSDGAPHPDAVVTPAQIAFEQGACRTNVQVTAGSPLTGYMVAMTLPDGGPATQAVSQAKRTAAASAPFLMLPLVLTPTIPVAQADAFNVALAAILAATDSDSWSSPLPDLTTLEVAGTFGEWRGHKRYGVPHDNIHAGLDLVAPAGTSVVAARGGIVTKNNGEAGGRFITIDHLDGTYSRYLHLSRSAPPPALGPVNRGALLGQVGSAAHLHFEIRTGASGSSDGQPGKGVDPLQRAGIFAVQTAQTLSELRGVAVTATNPATETYRTPGQPSDGSSTTAFVIVQVKQPENGRRLAPRSVRFKAEDMGQFVELSTPDTIAIENLKPRKSTTLPAGFARYLHGDSDTPNVDEYFRYWFRWNVAGYQADPKGPRTFGVEADNYAGTANAKTLKWGPEILSINQTSASGEPLRYRVTVRAWVGEAAGTPSSDVSGGGWATGSDWYSYELPSGGLWVSTGSTILDENKSTDSLYKLRSYEFTWSPTDPSTSGYVTVRSRAIPSIAHSMPISGTGAGIYGHPGSWAHSPGTGNTGYDISNFRGKRIVKIKIELSPGNDRFTGASSWPYTPNLSSWTTFLVPPDSKTATLNFTPYPSVSSGISFILGTSAAGDRILIEGNTVEITWEDGIVEKYEIYREWTYTFFYPGRLLWRR